ncbi:hypothetical protein KSI01_28800 [Kurthia sibirica]|nr:hypothetical protein KSI01_28800 [Kurthia sibirica]
MRRFQNKVNAKYNTPSTNSAVMRQSSDDVDHIQISVDQVSHNYQSEIDVPNNKTTLTLNDDFRNRDKSNNLKNHRFRET